MKLRRSRIPRNPKSAKESGKKGRWERKRKHAQGNRKGNRR